MRSPLLAARPARYERLTLAPFACALLVVGGLLAAGQAAAAADSDRTAVKTACADPAQYAPSASWSADAALHDPDTDNDGENDDDDDVVGGDAAITTDVAQPAAYDVSVSIDQPTPSWISRTTDGHSLRGPPAINQDSSDLEWLDDDDDDDDDDLISVATAATTLSRLSHITAFAGPPPAISSPSLSRAQRAPPISSL